MGILNEDLQTLRIIKTTVNEVSNIYIKHTEPWFAGLIVHGSAVKGGFIPNCSDIDFKLYLKESAFNSFGKLPLEVGLMIQKDLSKISPKPFRYIQCDVININDKKVKVLIPGTYQVVRGKPQIVELTNAQLIENARKALNHLVTVPDFIIDTLVEHGGARLSSNIRLLCTQVWPILYHILTLQNEEAIYIWNLPKHKAVELTDENSILGQKIREFYSSVISHYPKENSIENALEIVKSGISFLEISKAWWAQNS